MSAVIDAAHLERQRAWSEATFGPGRRTLGVIDHIKKELVEIEAEPLSLEWVDVVILALDGAWRAGHEPQAIIDAIVAKQAKNEARKWPPPGPEDRATEHIRDDKPSAYPEHEKLAAVKDQSQAIGEFLDWLNGDGVHLARWDEEWDRYFPVHESINALLARRFGIDLDRIEAEKRAMLDEIRAVQR